jgi:hypothetical protein
VGVENTLLAVSAGLGALTALETSGLGSHSCYVSRTAQLIQVVWAVLPSITELRDGNAGG